MYEGDDLNTVEEEAPPEESGNRTFLLVAGGLGLIVLLSVVCLAVYGFYVIPRQAAQRADQQATLIAQNLKVNEGLTKAALAANPTATPTLEPTATPPFAQATPTLPAQDPQTATVAAALSQAAQAQLTVTALPTTTALPDTGFFDDAGASGLFVMAIALVVVIMLARRLRASPVK